MVARSRGDRQRPRQGPAPHRLADECRPVQGRRRPHLRSHAAQARQAGPRQPRRGLSGDLQLQARQVESDRRGPLGAGLAEGEYRRLRRLHHRELQARRDHHLRRNPDWNRGSADKPAGFKRIITQTIPEAATRANLVEKGDADIVIDLQATDAADLEKKGKLKVVSTPQYNAITFVSFNNQIPPFDKIEVRKAIAAALPYEDMFKAALFGRGKPLYGATWADGKAPSGDTFPIVQPVKTDIEAAKKLLAAAGMPDGFSTTFSFNVGQAGTAEPMAALLKESLAKIGIKVDIQKLPDAQMSTLINEKKVPFFTEGIVAWLPSMDYFYRNFYIGPIRWNYSSLNDPQITEWAQAARFEPDPAKYAAYGKDLNTRHFELMPQIPLWQPSQDAVMQPSVEGYVYQFHRQIDFRDLSRK